MPRITASWDDAVVGRIVPSTTADPSKGTVTTRPASSSSVRDARDAGNQAVIARPTRKFGMRKLAVIRAPT